MIHEFKKVWKQYTIGMLWLLGLLWPLMGIHADGTLTFQKTITVWSYILAGTFVCLIIYVMKASGYLKFISNPISRAADNVKAATTAFPSWVWIVVVLGVAEKFSPNEGEWLFSARWIVSGSVGHWGHVHTRRNQYEGEILLRAVDGYMKIGGLDVTDETRVDPMAGGRGR